MRASLRFTVLLAAIAAAAGSTGPSAQAQNDRAASMRDHYAQVLVVHAAVIRGDLPAVAGPAHELIQRLAASNAPQATIDEMRFAAKWAANTRNLAVAATAAASMLQACGDCHSAAGVMPTARLPGQPAVGGVVGRMLEHQRAAEQMLQGLVMPSTALWREGAKAFAGAPLHPRDLPANTAERLQMVGVEERLQSAAGKAADETDSSARASAYAFILAACADCHSKHAKIWGPSR